MKYIITFIFLILFSNKLYSSGLNVFGIGAYNIFDESNDAKLDYRYERRYDKSIFEIGPEEDNFFFLKPFIGFEYTSDHASYFLTGIYLDDNIGQLTKGKENNIIFTPSFGVGYYDDGSGMKLGHVIQFRTTFELSLLLKNNNRIGFSLGHISNGNLGDKNPGVEIFSLSYQVPY